MNFRKKFPELDWEYGYFLFWGICVIAAIVMLFYFQKEKMAVKHLFKKIFNYYR